MKSIARLFAAFANLAGSLEALAGVVDAATGQLRQRLAYEAEESPAVIEHQPEGKGRKAKG